ncbi:MAG: iron ABC transporter permease [Spirochaetales bacterium]|jgi:thiamine transport system permease protein|nr:iron ABC transporter permease [Spirochaetales bacterium]
MIKKKESLLFLLPLLFLGVFFYLPLGFLFLFPGGTATLAGPRQIMEVLGDPYYRRVLGFTFAQAALSTGFAVLLGLPGGWFLGRFDFPGRRALLSLCSIPFVLPSLLVVLGFVLFFGNNGYLNRFLQSLTGLREPPLKILYSLRAVILAHGFYNFPVIIRCTAAACRNLSPSRRRAAASLGAGKPGVFWTVTLRELISPLLSGAMMVFLLCFMSFSVILVLGGGPRYSTLEVEIYRLARLSLDFPQAAALGFWGTACTLLMRGISLRLQKKAAVISEGGGSPPEALRPSGGILMGVYFFFCAVFVLGPLVSILVNSFQTLPSRGAGAAFTLRHYRELFGGGALGGLTINALGNSLFFGLATALLVMPAACLAAFGTAGEKNRLGRELLFMLPSGVSSVLLGLGYLRLRSLLSPGPALGRIFILAAHVILAFPFVLRHIAGGIRSLPPRLSEAASVLGASGTDLFFSVRLPLIKGTLFSALVFAFCLSLGEINTVLLLAPRNFNTLPLVMYRLIGAHNFYAACVPGVLLMALSGLAFWAMDKTAEGKIERSF